MKRIIDIFISITALVFLSPIFLLIAYKVRKNLGSPIFFYQERPGKDGKLFKMMKFRSMKNAFDENGTPLPDEKRITPFGQKLRSTSLDEMPQLINVLKGEMSFVGPRPNLFNQQELIEERDKLCVYDVLPGITGLAQINNIDMSTPKLLAETDKEMIKTLSLKKYFGYIMKTALGKGRGDAVKQYKIS